MAVSVLIVCDIRIYREGIVRALESSSEIEIVGSASNSDDALSALERGEGDVVLLDMAMAGALTTLQRIHAVSSAKVVALTVAETHSGVVSCAEAGVTEVLTREASLADVIASIHAAMKGELRCSPRVGAFLLERVATLAARSSTVGPTDLLTSRQIKILELLEAGQSNKEIARTLNIEVATVKNHVHSILDRLNVSKRGQAAALYRRQVGNSL